MLFVNRRDAGRQLAKRLSELQSETPVVLGLPRGGVPVAAEVAARLQAPLEVLIVRKLGCPWQPELGIGAIGEGGVRVLNDELIARLGVSAAELDAVGVREWAELTRRARAYRGTRPAVPVEDRVVVVVDDGLATGFTARAAIAVLRRQGTRRVVLAVPVAPLATADQLLAVADEVVCLHTPTRFLGISAFYEDFRQTSDDEVRHLLTGTSAEVAAAAHYSGPTIRPGRTRTPSPTSPRSGSSPAGDRAFS
jgi:putative phosphoribosyl transferase